MAPTLLQAVLVVAATVVPWLALWAASSLLQAFPGRAQRAGSWNRERDLELFALRCSKGHKNNAIVGTSSSDARNSTSRHIVQMKIVLKSVAMGITTRSSLDKFKTVAEEEYKFAAWALSVFRSSCSAVGVERGLRDVLWAGRYSSEQTEFLGLPVRHSFTSALHNDHKW